MWRSRERDGSEEVVCKVLMSLVVARFLILLGHTLCLLSICLTMLDVRYSVLQRAV